MNQTDSYILTVVFSVAAFMASQKWIFPLVVRLWNWIRERKKNFDDENVDKSKEILSYKKDVIETQDSQFQMLLNQITALEEELARYSEELQTMRNTILKLNARLYDKLLIISELQKNSCCIKGCKMRVLCENKLNEIYSNNNSNNTNENQQ